MITNQEAFSKVWQWFVVEKHPQCAENGLCLYRGPNGNKCAIGCFIPDGEYRVEFDSTVGNTTAADVIPQCPSLVNLDTILFSIIQTVHDRYEFDEPWEFTEHMNEKLTDIAHDFSLTIPE